MKVDIINSRPVIEKFLEDKRSKDPSFYENCSDPFLLNLITNRMLQRKITSVEGFSGFLKKELDIDIKKSELVKLLREKGALIDQSLIYYGKKIFTIISDKWKEGKKWTAIGIGFSYFLVIAGIECLIGDPLSIIETVLNILGY